MKKTRQNWKCVRGIGVKKAMVPFGLQGATRRGLSVQSSRCQVRYMAEKKRFVLAAEPIFAVSSVTQGIDFNTTLSRGGEGGEPKKRTNERD